MQYFSEVKCLVGPLATPDILLDAFKSARMDEAKQDENSNLSTKKKAVSQFA
jgi:hypothetical protein